MSRGPRCLGQKPSPVILAGADHPLRPTAPGTLCRHRGFPSDQRCSKRLPATTGPGVAKCLSSNERYPASRGDAEGDPVRGPGWHVLSGRSRNTRDSVGTVRSRLSRRRDFTSPDFGYGGTPFFGGSAAGSLMLLIAISVRKGRAILRRRYSRCRSPIVICRCMTRRPASSR